MNETDDESNLSQDGSTNGGPSTAVVFGIIAAVLLVALGLIMHGKSHQRVRDSQAAALEHDLDADKAALQFQKDKIVQITQELDARKQKFELGYVKDEGKAEAVKGYNMLAAQQRAEREKFTQMANAYNEKVSKLRELK